MTTAVKPPKTKPQQQIKRKGNKMAKTTIIASDTSVEENAVVPDGTIYHNQIKRISND